ncbi:transketolase [Thermoplasmatales archaeon SW_10_69_26]|nr:MAG: transketolase [Thermoplasmatales archaeon SW_10_69_26]
MGKNPVAPDKKREGGQRLPEPIRNGYGHGLLKAGREREEIVALDADLAGSTRSQWFGEEFPDRFYQMGISEQDMMVTAVGMASAGKHPFASTFAIFSERAFEQVRNSVARMDANVKIVGSHGGVLTGQDGSSAQCIEDLAVYRAIPNMTVLCPSDVVESEAATLALAEYEGPAYMRTTRRKTPIHHDEDTTFEIGEGEILREGEDVALVGTGSMTGRAMQAAERLEAKGVSALVANMPTIKPIDRDLVAEISQRTGHVVTCEDHNVIGALGSAVAEALAETRPAKMARVGIDDHFGRSGTPDKLYEAFGLTPDHIVEEAERLVGNRVRA